MMKIHLLAIALFSCTLAYTQGVGVNSDGAMPVAGTMLDVKGATDDNTTYGMQVKNSSGNVIMVVRSDGNVGVGTSTPTRRFTVQKAAGASADADIWSTDGTQWTTLNSNSGGGSWNNLVVAGDHTLIYSNGVVESGALTIGPWNSTSKGMRIDPNGNLGIGTSSSGSKLTIREAGESATLTNFTQGLTNAGIQISTEYTNGAYTPGVFWQTSNENATKPKAGIWLFENGGGTDMYFGTSNTYGTGITNNGLVLDQSGNVGIGTTTPAQNFSVAGTLGISEAGATGNRLRISTSGSGTIINHADNSPMIFQVNSSEAMRIADGGNIGIGTTSPTAALDISGKTVKFSNDYPTYTWRFGGSNDLNWKNIATVTVGTGSYKAVSFEVKIFNAECNYGCSGNGQTYTYNVAMRRSTNVQDAYNDAVVTGPSANYVRAVKTSTGNYELQVRQSTNWRHMRVEARVTSHNNGVTISYIDSPANGSTSGTIYTATAGLSGSANYIVNQTASDQSAGFRITGDGTFNGGSVRVLGNNGISFDTHGGGWYMSDATWIRATNSKRIYTPTIIRADGGFQVDGSQVIDADGGWHRSYGNTGWYNNTWGGGIYMVDASWIRTYGNKNFYHNTGIMRTDGTFQVGGGGARFLVQTGGNVGIGDTSPAQKLEVNGRVKSNGINETSDIRLKKNVSVIPNALSSVQQMQGVFYNWKSPEELEKENIDTTLSPNTERIEMGFIAQDLEKIIPELVDTDNEGYKSVQYSKVVALLTEAIKELKTELNNEKAANKQQQEIIERLEVKLKKHEAILDQQTKH